MKGEEASREKMSSLNATVKGEIKEERNSSEFGWDG